MSGRYVGIDVGARQLHCSALDADGQLLGLSSVATSDVEALVEWCREAEVVAIDAPAAASSSPHAGSDALAPKFRSARCAEIALGREHGSWVSWVTPIGPPFPSWMDAGFAVYGALRPSGAELLEVYPYAGFRELAGGGQLARKRTAAGRRARAELLVRAGVKGPDLASRPHDELDALVASLIALQRSRDSARSVSCGHDGSAIWLPAGPV